MAALKPSAAWLAACAMLIMHQVLQYGIGVDLPFLDSYLDPLLSVPILIGLAQAERSWLFGATNFRTHFNTYEVIGMTIGIALVGEYVFPWLDPERQVFDVWDFVAYGLGGFGVILYRRFDRGCRDRGV